jgi:hypothetical protein
MGPVNKTINQMLRYHVKHNQKGWVCTLPCIQFQIMNTVNASTKFSSFQLYLGCSPRLMLALSTHTTLESPQVTDFLHRWHDDIAEAKDNLTLAKIMQAHHKSNNCAPEPDFKINDLVMLSTKNRRQE